ncbi:uncharacterized protein Z519_01313 [Cladophialophora bantiana CBS 173.52]|uniref:F-box domain-containing protein n=1 Tax=Cladophialophora bantiana (strain ATCC 10958 / CBS 173.52 / CDC B-1940 / NIH 8579) TaxID=1442370 RepID=A0A0D2ILQ3_CLAB1|nr:uncharacterized protein Z519_01313 [Cladophialophora bantiana CBS 173.52]KIW97729.1 hypothetical protein Z519_01313 [Cladophialophora bantiana CBS 173.52]
MVASKILSLEAEVLANILEYVDDESPHTTAAVTQTCKHLNYVVKLVRYRRLTIHWDQKLGLWVDWAGRKQAEWETPELLQGLRQLTVRGGARLVLRPEQYSETAVEETYANINRLNTVVRNVSHLKTLVWQVGCLPTAEFIQTLQAYQPNVKMELHRANRLEKGNRPLESEKVLSTAGFLSTFSMITTSATYVEDTMLFQMILCSAPSLKFASLISPQIRLEGSEVASLQSNFESWLPQDQRTPSSSLYHLTLDGWELSGECLDYWSQYVNFASLKSLKCSRGLVRASFFERASQVLTNLKSVSINLGPESSLLFDRLRIQRLAAAAEHYIATCPPLLTLSVWSWRGKVPLHTILNQHGASLEELQLHEREDPDGLSLRDPFSVEELRSIRESCPRLRVLTIDLNRISRYLGIGDYGETLDELRGFNLDKIQIYLDSGMRWFRRRAQNHFPSDPDIEQHGRLVDDDQTPPLDDVNLPSGCRGDIEFEEAKPFRIETGEVDLGPRIQDGFILLQPPSTHKDICRFLIKTWKIIFASKTTGPRQLDLKFGEWESRVQPLFLAAGRHSMRDIKVWCRARPHERDDMAGECAVEIDCCGGRHTRKFASGEGHIEGWSKQDYR